MLLGDSHVEILVRMMRLEAVEAGAIGHGGSDGDYLRVEIGQLPYERQDDAVLDLTPTPLLNLAQPEFEDLLLARCAREPMTAPASGGIVRL